MAPSTSPPSIFETASRLRARRVGFLVDAEDYFATLAYVLERARRSVFIVGWDLHTEVHLRRDGSKPETLGDVLRRALRTNRQLHVYILLWDYALIYLFERQPLPLFSFVWLSHPRIHIYHDDTAPIGASHHQKLVVVDDALAFVGGIDLTLNRWDTRAHHADDERRTDYHEPYPPLHDVQVAMTGEAAEAVARLARSRWEKATGKKLRRRAPPADSWPDGLEASIEEAEVILVHSTRGSAENPTDIERSYVDAVGIAQRWLYFETPYFTSAAIGEALEASLRRADGPEIVLVLPRDASGWLERSTMDVLRTRRLRSLQAADRHERLRVYHPVVPSTAGPATPVYVHAKVLVVDDVVARVGSSNLTNRSMGFDTECDLLILGDTNSTTRRGIAALHTSLLAEHLGCSESAAAERLQETGSLIRTIESLSGGQRSLLPGVTMAPEWMLDALPDRTVVDPERPLELGKWVDEGLPRASHADAEVNLKAITLLAGLGAAAVVFFDVSGAARTVIALRIQPEASLIVLSGYCLAVLLPIPATLLHVAAVLLDGPLGGLALAALGSSLNATLAFAAGRRLGRNTIRRWAGARLNRIARRLTKRGAIGVAIVRALPITPFSIEGLVAGASGVRVGDYVVGTLLGATPNLLIAVVTVSALRRALQAPSLPNGALAALAFAALALAAVLIGRRVDARNHQ